MLIEAYLYKNDSQINNIIINQAETRGKYYNQ